MFGGRGIGPGVPPVPPGISQTPGLTGPLGSPGVPSQITGAPASGDLDRGAYDKMFAGTPLAGQYDTLVRAAQANNVPPSLMAAIMAHETGRGTSAMLREKNNPAGLMDPKTGAATGQSFGSIEEGIAEAGRRIGKNYRRGGGTIAGMAGIYAPVGAANDPRGLNRGWAAGVEGFQRRLARSGSAAAGGPPATPKGSMLAATGLPPEAFIFHHTSGRGTIEGVQETLRERHLGVEYAMDREGNIRQIGGPGSSHMLTGWGAGAGLSNKNTVGMEVIAKDDKDVTPAQIAAAQRFIRENYPNTPVFGHGQVNPGHKEADEGLSIVNAIKAERAGMAGGGTGRVARAPSAGGEPIVNYFKRSGASPIRSADDPRLTTIGVGDQKWQVNKEAAPHLQGFLNELREAGAPNLTAMEGWKYRNIIDPSGRDTGKLSEHAYGGAIDVAQTGFGGTLDKPNYANIPRDFADWARAHRDVLQASERRWNIYGGERFGDLGHFEYGGGGTPGREALNRRALAPQTHRVEGSASIDVNVAAPPGTRVAASSAGMFKPVQMNRQTQMAFADGGPHVPAGSQFGVAS
jgi:general stress protein YciG